VHGDVGGVHGRVAIQHGAAGGQLSHLLIQRQHFTVDRGSLIGFGAVERVRCARAALIDHHHIALEVQALSGRHHRQEGLSRSLPRPAGHQEDRVRRRVAAVRRDYSNVQLDLPPIEGRRVFGHSQRATLGMHRRNSRRG
jgi:hypothetical protein